MRKLVHAVALFAVLATVVVGGALGVGLACAGDVPGPGPQYLDTRVPPADTSGPGFLDGLGRRDVFVWEDGTPADGEPADGEPADGEPADAPLPDGWYDLQVSGTP